MSGADIFSAASKRISVEKYMNNRIKTILVSPHSDDIAYSIGGSLLQDFFMKPVLMVTVFTRSNYSPNIKTNDIEISSKIRQSEDIEFINKVKIDYQSFQFSEPPLRGYSHNNMFECNNPALDPIYSEVYNSLRKLIKSYPCELIVAPIGLGNHIDHIMICDICHKISRENNIKIIFYEDLPYALWVTLNQIKMRANSITSGLQPVKIDITPEFNDKYNNIKLYKSQRWIFQILIKLYSLRVGMEDKRFLELMHPNNLLRYFMCLFTNKCTHATFFERFWVDKGVEDEYSFSCT